MGTGNRFDFYGVEFMPEATFGTDPGIVAASFVDGTTETVPFVPDTGSGLKAFMRVTEVSGLPVTPLVPLETKKQIDDYADQKFRGPKGVEGEFTLTTYIHGWSATPGVLRPTPPPWLQLAASACGTMYGEQTADEGGSADTIGVSPTDEEVYAVTTGDLIDGHVHAVDGPGASTDIELVRPEDAALLANVAHLIRLSTTPIAAEDVYYSAQAHFHKGEEASAEEFTIMINRSKQESAVMMVGCRCVGWEINAEVGEIPSIALRFQYANFFDEDTDAATVFSGYAGITDEPAYYVTAWPDTNVTQASFLVSDTGSARESFTVSAFKATWDAGYIRHTVNTATAGVNEIFANGRQIATMEFTLLYDEQFRAVATTGGLGSATFKPWMYYEGGAQGQIWFICMPAGQLMEDPGFEGERESNQAMTLMYEAFRYVSDTDAYAAGLPADTKLQLGVV